MSGYITIDGVNYAVAQVKTDYDLRRRWLDERFAVPYEFADYFTTDEAGPITEPRTAEPGPGTWNINQTVTPFSIQDSELNIAPSSNSTTQGMTRNDTISQADFGGHVIEWRWYFTLGNLRASTGVRSSGGVAIVQYGIERRSGGDGILRILISPSDSFELSRDFTTDEWHEMAISLRAVGGSFYLWKVDNKWKLLYMVQAVLHTTLRPNISTLSSSASPILWDYIRVPEERWVPTALVSDSFMRIVPNDTLTAYSTDGLGHPEQNGGSGLTWVQPTGSGIMRFQDGTTDGKSICQGISSVNVAVIPIDTDSFVAEAVFEVPDVTSSATFGIAYRSDLDSTDNWWVAEVRGVTTDSDIRLRKKEGGNTNTMASASITTWTNNTPTRLVAIVDGDKHTIVWNDTEVTTPFTDSFNQDKQNVGLSQNHNQVLGDDFVVWPRYPADTGPLR